VGLWYSEVSTADLSCRGARPSTVDEPCVLAVNPLSRCAATRPAKVCVLAFAPCQTLCLRQRARSLACCLGRSPLVLAPCRYAATPARRRGQADRHAHVLSHAPNRTLTHTHARAPMHVRMFAWQGKGRLLAVLNRTSSAFRPPRIKASPPGEPFLPGTASARTPLNLRVRSCARMRRS
jgi:hypothetical protein